MLVPLVAVGGDVVAVLVPLVAVAGGGDLIAVLVPLVAVAGGDVVAVAGGDLVAVLVPLVAAALGDVNIKPSSPPSWHRCCCTWPRGRR